MYRTALRAAPRRIVSPRTLCHSSNRFISTAPPAKKSRSWKSSAARWGLAAAGIYYYNTSNVFAEEPEAAIKRLDDSIHHIQDSSLPTVDAVVEEKRRRRAEQAAEDERRQRVAEAAAAVDEEAGDGAESDGDGLGGLEEEADQQGAFNPETGEINWDCPCLGGMAHGPCGDEFKEAFSCFIYSKEEPKGVECIDKFKTVSRLHPEMYGSELEDDDEEVEQELRSRDSVSDSSEAPASSDSESSTQDSTEIASKPTEAKSETPPEPHRDSSSTTADEAEKLGDEGGELIPRSLHDATSK